MGTAAGKDAGCEACLARRIGTREFAQQRLIGLRERIVVERLAPRNGMDQAIAYRRNVLNDPRSLKQLNRYTIVIGTSYEVRRA